MERTTLPQYTTIRVSEDDGVFIIGFPDPKILDEAVIHKIGLEMIALADSRSDPKVVFNFQGVDYISSMMIGALVIARKNIINAGGCTGFCHVCPGIMGHFRITRLSKVFEISDTEERALQEIRRRR